MPSEKSHLVVGKRKVHKIGGSLMIVIPPEFAEIHGIREGDELPFAANHILQVTPMPREKQPDDKS